MRTSIFYKNSLLNAREGNRQLKQFSGVLKFLFLLIIPFQFSVVKSQTTLGKDFWLNFLPQISADSMFVIISTPNGAKGKVEMPRKGWSENFNLAAGKLTRIYVPSTYKPKQSDTLNDFGIQVTSDNDISVYAISAAPATTDASCVFPKYVHPDMARYVINTTANSTRGNSFSIVANEDLTQVEITPTMATTTGRLANRAFTVTLAKGQVYVCQSASGDFSNSNVKVLSPGKKVNVFAGDYCVRLVCGACDHLYEQIPPTNVLGKKFIVTPFYGGNNGYEYAVTAIKNNTVVKRMGTVVDTLNANETFRELFSFDSTICIETSNETMVMQYMLGCNSYRQGDPAQLLISPLEQTIQQAIVSTANTTIIKDHFLNILIPKTGLTNCKLDGNTISSTRFRRITCNDYYFYSDTTSPGNHTIQCNAGFICYVYGLGGYESYAYCAGNSLRNLDLSFKYEELPNCDSSIVVRFSALPDTLSAYKWTFHDNTKDTGLHPIKVFLKEGAYKVKLFGKSKFKNYWDSTEIEIVLIKKPKIDFINFDTITVCDSAYSIKLPNSPVFKYEWNMNYNDSTATKVITKTSFQRLKVTNRVTKCTELDSGYIKMYNKVYIDFKYTAKDFCPNSPVLLEDISTVKADSVLKRQWFVDFIYKGSGKQYTIKSPYANNYDINMVLHTKNGCKDSVQKRITISEIPYTKFKIYKKDSCVNNNFFTFYNLTEILIGKIKGYKWNFSDGDTSTSLKTIYKSFKDSGMQWAQLTAYTDGGCVDTTPKLYFKVYPKAYGSMTMKDSIPCLKSNNFTFSNTTNEKGKPHTYEWNWGDATGTTFKDPIPKVYADTGTYTVQLVSRISKTGCADTIFRKVTVLGNPLAALSLDSLNFCLNNNYFQMSSLSDAKGGLAPSHTWKWGDGTQTIGTDKPRKKYNTTGTFKLWYIFQTGKGCMDSVSKNLPVLSSPKSLFTITDSNRCDTSNFYLLNNGSTAPANGRYTWTYGDGNSSTVKSPGKVKYASTGTYQISLVVLDPLNKCSDTSSKSVSVFPVPQTSIVVNDSLQCLKNNSFVFTDSTNYNGLTPERLWRISPGATYTDSQFTVVFKNSGTYKVTLRTGTLGVCPDSASININVGSSLNSSIQVNNDAQCMKTNSFSFKLKNTGPKPTSFKWMFNDDASYSIIDSVFTRKFLTTGVKGVLLETVFGQCIDTFKSNIEIFADPKINLVNITADSQCLTGNIFNINSTITGGKSTFNYSWFADEPGHNGTNANFSETFTTTGTRIITLTVNDANNCKDTANSFVGVWAHPDVDFAISNVCAGEEAVINGISNSGSAPSNWDWDFGDGNSGSGKNVKHLYPIAPGSYNVNLIATSTNGCKTSVGPKLIQIYPRPSANFRYDVLYPSNSKIPVVFTDSSIGATEWNWSFESGSNGTGKTVNYNYNTVGDKIVKLKVLNSFGCADSITRLVSVTSPINAFFPNSFSPEGNGLNETFGPEGLGPVKKYELKLYNRWGQLIFEDKAGDKRWDGKYMNVPCMEGVYAYSIYIVFLGGDSVTGNGMVTLLR